MWYEKISLRIYYNSIPFILCGPREMESILKFNFTLYYGV